MTHHLRMMERQRQWAAYVAECSERPPVTTSLHDQLDARRTAALDEWETLISAREAVRDALLAKIAPAGRVVRQPTPSEAAAWRAGDDAFKAESDELAAEVAEVDRARIETIGKRHSTPTSSVDLLRTCYHEAGHAVVALRAGRRIRSIRITDAGGGLTRYSIDPNESRFDRAALALAGGLAEREAGLYEPACSAKDDKEARKAAKGRPDDFLSRVAATVQERLRVDGPTVRLIAGALHRRRFLTGRDIDALLDAERRFRLGA